MVNDFTELMRSTMKIFFCVVVQKKSKVCCVLTTATENQFETNQNRERSE